VEVPTSELLAYELRITPENGDIEIGMAACF
jgi:hypothetical protein